VAVHLRVANVAVYLFTGFLAAQILGQDRYRAVENPAVQAEAQQVDAPTIPDPADAPTTAGPVAIPAQVLDDLQIVALQGAETLEQSVFKRVEAPFLPVVPGIR